MPALVEYTGIAGITGQTQGSSLTGERSILVIAQIESAGTGTYNRSGGKHATSPIFVP